MHHKHERLDRLDGTSNRSFYGLVTGFLLIIGLMVALAVYSATRMQAMHTHLESILEWHNVRVAHAYLIRVVVRDRMIAMNRMVMADDPISREEAYDRYLELAGVFMSSRSKLEHMVQEAGEREQLKALQRLAGVVTPLNDRIVGLARDDRQTEARSLLLEEAMPAQRRVLEQIDGILEEYRQAANQVETHAHHELEQTITLFWLLTGIVLVMSCLIAVFTIYRVRRDRAALVDARDTEIRLRYLAHHDPLSGLFNRAGMAEHLQAALTQADMEGALSAALLLDLDGFKAINDTYGHEVGDRLLVSVAQRLINCVQREGDTVSRLAGDEFVILLCGLESREGADLVAQRVLKRLAEPHRLAGQELRVMASIGIAVYPTDADSGGALLHCADLAMYQAKQKGKSGYCHYAAVADTEATQRARDSRFVAGGDRGAAPWEARTEA